MKLLIVHNKYQSSKIGGEDIVYNNELQFLQEILERKNVFSFDVSNDGVSKFKLIFGIWFSFKYYQKIRKMVEKNHIDIVHVHNFYPLLTPSIFKAAKNGGAKVIHTLHNYRLWCISGTFYRDGYGVCELCTKHKFSFKGILNKCFRKSLVQSMLAQSSFWFYKFIKVFDNIDYFFVLTNFQKEKIKILGVDEKKIILKPNSLNMSFSRGDNKNGYVYVGRLEESKGIYELLKVWEKLDEQFVLIIVGSGDDEENIRNQYNKSNIIFKGKCSREKTLQIISSVKYLIQTSVLYETFGLTMIEAMNFGVPVIGFNVGTRKDFIQDGVNGFICSKITLKDVIEKSFEYKDYDFLSNHAILKAKKFENSYVVKKQIEIYKQILDEN
ncbi:glycosyl transferase, group 1 [Candidatus Ruthia magnifica str. Cm (Calyptogena magnifica)]|uniref:Glycosyl transferase, group 1 n=1 Tax=Ruthia magnifica subsp. Calyptogena magnifica TaxID=413404 RepID=A1AXE7_RUTMC|nr:glycosyltransferase [Candidatus Ruthturnera calyptogenae]ABL02604.1 glycosyl transferase, group 1 [Candidatus Ruthia magnifica str. Cm (Calyptogena magnifica)]